MSHRPVHAGAEIAAFAVLAVLAGGCSDPTGSDVVTFARIAEIEVPEQVTAGTPFTVRFAYELACGRLDRIDVRREAARTTIAVVIRMSPPANACPDMLRYAPVTLTLPAPTTSQHVVRFRQPGGDDASFLTVAGGD